MDKSILEAVAFNLGEEIDDISPIIDEFMLQLHKKMVEYKGLNGSYISEELSHTISPQAFYHFLGFLDEFSNKYRWEEGDSNEYLMRLGKQSDWLPYMHQTESWKRNKD